MFWILFISIWNYTYVVLLIFKFWLSQCIVPLYYAWFKTTGNKVERSIKKFLYDLLAGKIHLKNENFLVCSTYFEIY